MLIDRARSLLRSLRGRVAPLVRGDEYARRLSQEQGTYRDCENVHDLPEIFHYWSNRYLRPVLERFGFSNPDEFFCLYCERTAQRLSAPRTLRVVSIGCGNCDTEVRLAQALRARGVTDFRIECLDINRHMLERGRELAREADVAGHLVPLEADFNAWKPRGSYDVVLANQSLHHVVELERLFDAVRGCLSEAGCFITSDMIGRNGHQRWPEALEALQPFWDELPAAYRYNRLLRRHEERFMNHDCSSSGFEGIRAQDILPLLTERFHFELFIPFANLVTVFIDRPFGHNFDADGEWDRDFIDRVHAADEAGFLAGRFKPTQMFAVLRTTPGETQLAHPKLTPEFCIRPVETRDP